MVTFAYPEPQESVAETYTVIPEGDYDVEIVAVDEKQASAGYQMLRNRAPDGIRKARENRKGVRQKSVCGKRRNAGPQTADQSRAQT